MIIEMSESDKEAFIASIASMSEQAIQLTEQCVRILVEKHDAHTDWIDPMMFYYRYLSKLVEFSINGTQPTVPEEMVNEAIRLYKPEFLGLKDPGRYALSILASRQEWIAIVDMYKKTS